MAAVGKRPIEPPRGMDFVRLFKLNVDQFRLRGQKFRPVRDFDHLDRPYELSDLMRKALAAGVWPRQY